MHMAKPSFIISKYLNRSKDTQVIFFETGFLHVRYVDWFIWCGYFYRFHMDDRLKGL
jgi:hypothetical protein